MPGFVFYFIHLIIYIVHAKGKRFWKLLDEKIIITGILGSYKLVSVTFSFIFLI